jgi:hypothetical protein
LNVPESHKQGSCNAPPHLLPVEHLFTVLFGQELKLFF